MKVLAADSLEVMKPRESRHAAKSGRLKIGKVAMFEHRPRPCMDVIPVAASDISKRMDATPVAASSKSMDASAVAATSIYERMDATAVTTNIYERLWMPLQ